MAKLFSCRSLRREVLLRNVQDLKRVVSWLASNSSAVIFTGAGISTESGIPDFRSPGGVWAKYKPVYYQEFVSSQEARHEYWRQKCEAHQEFADAQPNIGHQVVASWEKRRFLRGVVTQNIDGLHQLAGSENVVEIHGTAREAVCLSCGDRNPIQPYVDLFLKTNEPPTCAKCSAPVKHATISFGQALDEETMECALRWMEETDLVLAMGSSLVVHPAAGLPEVAVNNGARLVIINRDPTPLDSQADLVLRGPLGQTLTAIDELVASRYEREP